MPGRRMETRVIKEMLSELGRIEASLVHDRGSGKRYLIPSPGSTKQRSLYAAVGLSSGGGRCLWILRDGKPESPGCGKQLKDMSCSVQMHTRGCDSSHLRHECAEVRKNKKRDYPDQPVQTVPFTCGKLAFFLPTPLPVCSSDKARNTAKTLS